MNQGELIYRVIKNKHDGKWYYCIYEIIKFICDEKSHILRLTIAPIITYYDAHHCAHSTIIVQYNSLDIIDFWAHDWDYVTTSEHLARHIYLQKTKDENQGDNENASISRDRD